MGKALNRTGSGQPPRRIVVSMGLIRDAARSASLRLCQVDFVPFAGAHEQLLLRCCWRPSDASDRPVGATLDAAAAVAAAAAAAATHRTATDPSKRHSSSAVSATIASASSASDHVGLLGS